jgi:hypothetical protein
MGYALFNLISFCEHGAPHPVSCIGRAGGEKNRSD